MKLRTLIEALRELETLPRVDNLPERVNARRIERGLGARDLATAWGCTLAGVWDLLGGYGATPLVSLLAELWLIETEPGREDA